MDNNELKYFLDSNTIPEIKRKPKTFLGIAKQPHYENVISNIYAFFFNVYEEHGLKDLFIKSLVEYIEELKPGKGFSNFIDFEIETEYSTQGIGKFNKKGRIDILLRNSEQAIIIENKVYHHLDNDLDDYWKSVKLDTEYINSKIGVILSLKPISQDLYKQFEYKDEYINITHSQLMKRVMTKSSSYLPVVETKYNHFLNDFYQNILNISSSTMKERDINFHTQNREKINQLVLFNNQFRKHIIAEVEKAGYGINSVKVIVPRHKNNERRLRYYRSTNYTELLYTIVFEELFTEKNLLHIIVEPRGKTLKNGFVLKKINFNDQERQILRDDFYSKTNEGWAHFASKSYNLNSENIADLSGFIQCKIEEDSFDTIFGKLEEYLVENPIDHIKI